MSDPATGSVAAPTEQFRPGSLQEAQAAFEKLMERTPATPTKQPPRQAPPPPAQEAEADEPPADEDAEAATADEDVNEDAEEQQSEEDDAPPTETLFTVTVDGKEEKVPASELIAGYQRNASYTRKSMALAEEKKAFERSKAEISAQAEEYAQLIPQLKKALTVPEPDWAKIKAESPEQYPALWADWQQHQARVQALSQEEQRVNAQRQREFEQAREHLISTERNAFLEKEPSWKDPKVAAKDAKDVEKVLRSVGFSDAELQIYDHRSLRLALMAAKYMRGQVAKGQVVRQRADSAPVIVPGSGPAKKVQAGKTERTQFLKSGSLKDAAAFFEKAGFV